LTKFAQTWNRVDEFRFFSSRENIDTLRWSSCFGWSCSAVVWQNSFSGEAAGRYYYSEKAIHFLFPDRHFVIVEFAHFLAALSL